MGKRTLPKNMTAALVRNLNDECELIRETNPYVNDCFGCVGVGWCSAVWEGVTATGERLNAKIVGNIDSGGLTDGSEKD